MAKCKALMGSVVKGLIEIRDFLMNNLMHGQTSVVHTTLDTVVATLLDIHQTT